MLERSDMNYNAAAWWVRYLKPIQLGNQTQHHCQQLGFKNSYCDDVSLLNTIRLQVLLDSRSFHVCNADILIYDRSNCSE